MKTAPMSLEDRLELAAQACHAAHLLSCEATYREAIAAISQESVRSEAWADRLEAMLHQVGHPDYSLKEFYEGIKLIVWELRQSPARVAEGDDVHSTELRK